MESATASPAQRLSLLKDALAAHRYLPADPRVLPKPLGASQRTEAPSITIRPLTFANSFPGSTVCGAPALRESIGTSWGSRCWSKRARPCRPSSHTVSRKPSHALSLILRCQGPRRPQPRAIDTLVSSMCACCPLAACTPAMLHARLCPPMLSHSVMPSLSR